MGPQAVAMVGGAQQEGGERSHASQQMHLLLEKASETIEAALQDTRFVIPPWFYSTKLVAVRQVHRAWLSPGVIPDDPNMPYAQDTPVAL